MGFYKKAIRNITLSLYIGEIICLKKTKKIFTFCAQNTYICLYLYKYFYLVFNKLK